MTLFIFISLNRVDLGRNDLVNLVVRIVGCLTLEIVKDVWAHCCDG